MFSLGALLREPVRLAHLRQRQPFADGNLERATHRGLGQTAEPIAVRICHEGAHSGIAPVSAGGSPSTLPSVPPLRTLGMSLAIVSPSTVSAIAILLRPPKYA